MCNKSILRRLRFIIIVRFDVVIGSFCFICLYVFLVKEVIILRSVKVVVNFSEKVIVFLII